LFLTRYPDDTQLPPYTGAGPVLDGRSLVKTLYNLWSQGFLAALKVQPYREEGDTTVEALMEKAPAVSLDIPEYTHVTPEYLKTNATAALSK
jgi:hypothetical protein